MVLGAERAQAIPGQLCEPDYVVYVSRTVYLLTTTRLQVEDVKPKLTELKRKVRLGKMTEMHTLEWAVHAFGDADKGAWKKVRAERIARNVRKQAQSDIEWRDADEAGYKKLHEARKAASLEKFSDDEE